MTLCAKVSSYKESLRAYLTLPAKVSSYIFDPFPFQNTIVVLSYTMDS